MKTYRNQLIFIKDKESKSSLLKHAVFLILPCVQSNSTEWCHVWLLVEKIGILFVDNNKWPLFLSRWLGICITPTKLPSFTLKSTNLGQGHLSKIIPCQKSQNISITKVPSIRQWTSQTAWSLLLPRRRRWCRCKPGKGWLLIIAFLMLRKYCKHVKGGSWQLPFQICECEILVSHQTETTLLLLTR